MIRLRYADLPIVKVYNHPLAFPLLDAFPSTLFSTSTPTSSATNPTSTTTRQLSLTSSLSTTSHTKQTIFELRDLVTRFNRAIDLDEREDLYNSLTEVGERYTFGFESDGEDEWGSGED